MSDPEATTHSTDDAHLYAVTFAGIVVKVFSTEDEAMTFADELHRKHRAATITVEVLA